MLCLNQCKTASTISYSKIISSGLIRGYHSAVGVGEGKDQPDSSTPKLKILRMGRTVFPHRNWHQWGNGRKISWQRTQLSWHSWPGKINSQSLYTIKTQSHSLKSGASDTTLLAQCACRSLPQVGAPLKDDKNICPWWSIWVSNNKLYLTIISSEIIDLIAKCTVQVVVSKSFWLKSFSLIIFYLHK